MCYLLTFFLLKTRGKDGGRDNREDDGRMEGERIDRGEESRREKAGKEEERRVVWH